jgi:hypothetical protein
MLIIRPYQLVILRPAEPSHAINRNQVFDALLPREIPYLLALQLLTRTRGKFNILPSTIIKPVEEILLAVRRFPKLVVFAEVTSVPVFRIHHLKEVL